MMTINEMKENFKFVMDKGSKLKKELEANFISRNATLRYIGNGKAIIEWTKESYNDSDICYEIEVGLDGYSIRIYYQSYKNVAKVSESFEVIDYLLSMS